MAGEITSLNNAGYPKPYPALISRAGPSANKSSFCVGAQIEEHEPEVDAVAEYIFRVAMQTFDQESEEPPSMQKNPTGSSSMQRP